MLDDPSLIERAGKMLREELARDVTSGVAPPAERQYLVLSLLPQFLDMICESCDQPARQLTPTIERLMIEHTFHDLCGDHASGVAPADLGTKAIEHQVRVVVRVLERVRRKALAQGRWSSVPVTPIMFG